AGPGMPPVASTVGLSGAHAALYARSGFPTLCPGSTTTVTIAFLNTGSLGWYGNAALGTWGPEPGQDRASALGGDGSSASPATGWPSARTCRRRWPTDRAPFACRRSCTTT